MRHRTGLGILGPNGLSEQGTLTWEGAPSNGAFPDPPRPGPAAGQTALLPKSTSLTTQSQTGV